MKLQIPCSALLLFGWVSFTPSYSSNINRDGSIANEERGRRLTSGSYEYNNPYQQPVNPSQPYRVSNAGYEPWTRHTPGIPGNQANVEHGLQETERQQQHVNHIQLPSISTLIREIRSQHGCSQLSGTSNGNGIELPSGIEVNRIGPGEELFHRDDHGKNYIDRARSQIKYHSRPPNYLVFVYIDKVRPDRFQRRQGASENFRPFKAELFYIIFSENTLQLLKAKLRRVLLQGEEMIPWWKFRNVIKTIQEVDRKVLSCECEWKSDSDIFICHQHKVVHYRFRW